MAARGAMFYGDALLLAQDSDAELETLVTVGSDRYISLRALAHENQALRAQVKHLQCDLEALREVVEQLYHAPGAPGALAAAESFRSAASKM
jgi:prefoldin subunit 5